MDASIEDKPPLLHMAHAYRVAGGRELPTVVDDGRVVVGSSAIVEHIEARHREPPLIPADPELSAQVRLWAQWADELLAPHTRRIMTAHWLHHPRDAERYFFGGAPRRQRLVFRPLRRPFALTAAVYRRAWGSAVGASEARVDAAFGLLDEMLGSRRHLVGQSLSLADMSVAVAANMALVTPAGRERYARGRVVEWVNATLPEQYQRWL